MRATRAIIHLDNLRRNIEKVRKTTGPYAKICFPVKADAYGHGAVELSRFALKSGVEYLAVADIFEGAELRKAGITAPILLLSQALPEELPDIVSLQLIQVVSDQDYIEQAERAAEKAGRKLTIHLMIDTGMKRLGCTPCDAVPLASKVISSKWLIMGGTATHFSVAESQDPDDLAFTKQQLRLFKTAIDSMKKAGLDPGLVHAANSGALFFHEDSFFDMIRPGSFLYGYSESANPDLIPEPLMELCSTVVGMIKVKKGAAVSYGRTWTAQQDTCIGVIPVGYADGLPRSLSNNHLVRIRGKSYPLVGRICMDQCMVDLGPDPVVQRWDEVIIFGPYFLNAADIAEKSNTAISGITCNINKRVPRVYVETA